MKEQFREWQPRGRIKVKYWLNKKTGDFRYWETTAEILSMQIEEILIEYMNMGIKLTNRQLYYQLVGKAYIPNADEVYKRICSFLTNSRYAGLVDWDAIEDKDRIPEKHSEWNNVKSLVESAIYSYRLPRWQDQDYYVEMYCEKKAGINVLQPIAEKWHIYFGFNKGYSSASAMYDLSKRIAEQIQNGKEAIILYFGDHDPSGLDMVRDIRKRIEEFLTMGEEYIEPDFEVIPVALTMEQIKKYNPPPNPAKVTDPRAKKYIADFGRISWELDSLNAIELRKIAEKSVLEYLDIKKYDAWIEKEEKHKKDLRKFGRNYQR